MAIPIKDLYPVGFNYNLWVQKDRKYEEKDRLKKIKREKLAYALQESNKMFTTLKENLSSFTIKFPQLQKKLDAMHLFTRVCMDEQMIWKAAKDAQNLVATSLAQRFFEVK